MSTSLTTLPVHLPNSSPEPILPDEVEVQAAEQLGETYFSLRMSSLRAAAQHIFGARPALPSGDYAAIVWGNYQGV